MPKLGKTTLVVLGGGIALGTMLGAAADPEMKQPPAQPWRTALHQPVADGAEYRAADAWPADITTYRDSYAPSWANEELADWEPQYPAWTYSEFADETFAEPEAMADSSPLQPEMPAPAQARSAPAEPEALPPEPRLAGNLAALY